MEVYEIRASFKSLVGIFSYQNWMHSHINSTTANQRTPAECKDQSKHKGILVGEKDGEMVLEFGKQTKKSLYKNSTINSN